MIADGLRERFPVASVEVFNKGAASRVIDDDEIAAIAASSDAVIAGLGDCGACSACSLGDALKMEGAGVPSTVLISDVFIGHIASFSVAMGLPGYHTAVVPHPVSSKDDAAARGVRRVGGRRHRRPAHRHRRWRRTGARRSHHLSNPGCGWPSVSCSRPKSGHSPSSHRERG